MKRTIPEMNKIWVDDGHPEVSFDYVIVDEATPDESYMRPPRPNYSIANVDDGPFDNTDMIETRGIMTLLTENNGWGIVWMNDSYMVRHIVCGAYLRFTVDKGCYCRRQKQYAFKAAKMTLTPVDDLILMKYRLLTKGDRR